MAPELVTILEEAKRWLLDCVEEEDFTETLFAEEEEVLEKLEEVEL